MLPAIAGSNLGSVQVRDAAEGRQHAEFSQYADKLTQDLWRLGRRLLQAEKGQLPHLGDSARAEALLLLEAIVALPVPVLAMRSERYGYRRAALTVAGILARHDGAGAENPFAAPSLRLSYRKNQEQLTRGLAANDGDRQPGRLHGGAIQAGA